MVRGHYAETNNNGSYKIYYVRNSVIFIDFIYEWRKNKVCGKILLDLVYTSISVLLQLM